MRLRLNELQKVVKKTFDEEKVVETLREEVFRVLGPSVVTSGGLERIATAVNDRIDVLERTGRAGRLDFKPSVMLKLAESSSTEVRKLAARTLPEKFAQKLAFDRVDVVRASALRDAKLSLVKEAIKRYPTDDELRVIYKTRKRLIEAGLPNAKAVDEPFDYHGEKLGDSVKQQQGPELSDQWYADKAAKFIVDYGQNIEGQWEEPVVHRFCSSSKATSGVEVDEEKLLKAVKKKQEEHDDIALERDALKEVVKRLRNESDEDFMNESFQHFSDADVDPMKELSEMSCSASEFITKANEVMTVRQSHLPSGIRKYRLGEGTRRLVMFPCKARLPHNNGIRRIDEVVLDRFVESWNSQQALRGEPLVLSWSQSPTEVGVIGFHVELK